MPQNLSTPKISTPYYVIDQPMVAAETPPVFTNQDEAKVVPYMCEKCSKLIVSRRKFSEHQAQCSAKFQQLTSTPVSKINNLFPNKINSDKTVSSRTEFSNSGIKPVIIVSENAQQMMDDLFKVVSPSSSYTNTPQGGIQVSSGYGFSAGNMSSTRAPSDNFYSHQKPILNETMVNGAGYNNSSIQNENLLLQNVNQQQHLPNSFSFQDINNHDNYQNSKSHEFGSSNISQLHQSNLQNGNLFVNDISQQQQQIQPIINNNYQEIHNTFPDNYQNSQTYEFADSNASSSQISVTNKDPSNAPAPSINESSSDARELEAFMCETEFVRDFKYDKELMDILREEPFFD